MSTEPTADYGRAGRNLPLATAVGVGLFAIFALSLVTHPFVFALLVAVVMVLAVKELTDALIGELPLHMRRVMFAATPVIVISAYLGGPTWLLGTYVATMIALLIARLFYDQEKYVSNVSRALFVVSYAPLMAGFAVLLAAEPKGDLKVFALVLLTIGADIGGYFAGVLFGKHPMAPKISPKKSWEGFVGAIVLEMVIGALLWQYTFHDQWWQGAIAGVILAISATLGDLIESMIKRDLGIKDMSGMVPGHGGIMDRLDSLVINAAVAWVLFAMFI